jgi:hypothetical protein
MDHAEVTDGDWEWLRSVNWLTLWNVTLPEGFLASLPELWALDLRGGSATDLRAVVGCPRLRCLVVNQVRGLRDLSVLESLHTLELLVVYGLKQVTVAPSLSSLGSLRRLEVGQMRGLDGLGGFLDAPLLEELFLIRWVNVTAEDVERVKTHPTLAYFDWFAEDVPVSRWLPVLEVVALPKPAVVDPKDWFSRRRDS